MFRLRPSFGKMARPLLFRKGGKKEKEGYHSFSDRGGRGEESFSSARRENRKGEKDPSSRSGWGGHREVRKGGRFLRLRKEWRLRHREGRGGEGKVVLLAARHREEREGGVRDFETRSRKGKNDCSCLPRKGRLRVKKKAQREGEKSPPHLF